MTNLPRVPLYSLGLGYGKKQDGSLLYSWPYSVEYSPEYRADEFLIAEGDGRNGNGSFFTAAQVLEPQWHRHLELTETLWLVPLLERMSRHEPVSPRDILDLYEQIYGKPPESRLWAPWKE